MSKLRYFMTKFYDDYDQEVIRGYSAIGDISGAYDFFKRYPDADNIAVYEDQYGHKIGTIDRKTLDKFYMESSYANSETSLEEFFDSTGTGINYYYGCPYDDDFEYTESEPIIIDDVSDIWRMLDDAYGISIFERNGDYFETIGYIEERPKSIQDDWTDYIRYI